MKETPEKLRPYTFHGVTLDYSGVSSGREPVGDCPFPFCGTEKKFYVSAETGQFECKSCQTSGNVYTFIRILHEQSVQERTDEWLEELAQSRGISPQFLEDWGIAPSVITGEVIIPGSNSNGKMTNLYRWITDTRKNRKILLATPTMRHGLFGMSKWNPDLEYAILAEGPWTSAACREILSSCRGKLSLDNGKPAISIKPTAFMEKSLLSEWNVVGVPGCGTFRDVWADMFHGKDVLIMFDSDHPQAEGRRPDAWKGTLRTARILLESDKPPRSIRGLQWGKEGYDPTLPHGYDLRDAINVASYKNRGKRVKAAYNALLDTTKRLTPLRNTADAEKNGSVVTKKDLNREPNPVYCETFREVRTAWRKAFRWTDDLDITLTVMLAAAGSTSFPAPPGTAQVWLRVLGAPGTGKSSLCEALSVSHKYTFPLSIQKGFHSGARDQEGNSCSLVPHMDGKTVIIKDGDTLLNAGNTNQSLAELRDIYDGTSRARYRNSNEPQNYVGLAITMIIGGTKSLKKLNRSFLGDRFLDCIIYEKGTDLEMEANILKRAAFNALAQMRMGREEVGPDRARLLNAMELTAGYLHYLRENIEELSNEITFSDERVLQCKMFGELVSFMRARPDKELEEEDDEVELATRLSQQFVRLANSLAIVLNKQEVDEEVMRRVRKVAIDTSKGTSFSICRILNKYPNGLDARALGHLVNRPTQQVNKVCRFMSSVGMLRRSKRQKNNLWILRKEIKRLVAVTVNPELVEN